MKRQLTGDDLKVLEVRAKIAEYAARMTNLKPFEAAAYMNVAESTLWNMIAKNEIPSSKGRGGVTIYRPHIDAYKLSCSRGLPKVDRSEQEPGQLAMQNADG
jgi:excisionase family DNA binding protein